jgi:hypothetical protein
MATKQDGEVKVKVLVDRTGMVKKAEAIEGAKFLRAISEETAREWIFSKVGGQVRSRCARRETILIFNFELLPVGTRSGPSTRSYVVFPNRVEIRQIEPNIVVTPSIDPSHQDKMTRIDVDSP